MISFLICENLNDADMIFKNTYKANLIEAHVSGSSQQWINGSYQKTKPEYAFDQIDKKYDWCSNCGRSYDEHPFITFSIKQKTMKLSGYFIRAGCCYDGECCCEDSDGYCCHCCLYSWSFQISNDNSTWKTVHQIEKDDEMRYCKEKTYKFSEIYHAKYVRIIQDKPCPGEPPCIALNKVELLGRVDGDGSDFDDTPIDLDDEDVSIIGHISKQRF